MVKPAAYPVEVKLGSLTWGGSVCSVVRVPTPKYPMTCDRVTPIEVHGYLSWSGKHDLVSVSDKDKVMSSKVAWTTGIDTVVTTFNNTSTDATISVALGI